MDVDCSRARAEKLKSEGSKISHCCCELLVLESCCIEDEEIVFVEAKAFSVLAREVVVEAVVSRLLLSIFCILFFESVATAAAEAVVEDEGGCINDSRDECLLSGALRVT